MEYGDEESGEVDSGEVSRRSGVKVTTCYTRAVYLGIPAALVR